jgi:hypothetical protein
MPGMRRADRRSSNDDNELNNPRSRMPEPLSYHELKQQRDNARADRQQLQQQLQTTQLSIIEWEGRAQENYQLYLDEQTRAIELQFKYEEADTQRMKYLALYNETQELLKYERRSKAGIKGWGTRRKQENERLKQQISDMVVLLRESLERQQDSTNYLYLVGDRLDRIQRLMDFAEQESSQDPAKLLEKLMRVWLLVQKILAE